MNDTSLFELVFWKLRNVNIYKWPQAVHNQKLFSILFLAGNSAQISIFSNSRLLMWYYDSALESFLPPYPRIPYFLEYSWEMIYADPMKRKPVVTLNGVEYKSGYPRMGGCVSLASLYICINSFKSFVCKNDGQIFWMP